PCPYECPRILTSITYFLMSPAVGAVCKLLPTLLARERFLAGVSSLVSVSLMFLLEFLLADAAFEAFLSRVDSFVPCEICVSCEGSVAVLEIAFERFWSV